MVFVVMQDNEWVEMSDADSALLNAAFDNEEEVVAIGNGFEVNIDDGVQRNTRTGVTR
jgi:hypothetical protein